MYAFSPPLKSDDKELAAESRLDAAFTYHAVQDLRKTLRGIGSDLVVRSGDAAEEMTRLVDQAGASHVFYHSRYVQHGTEGESRGRGRETYMLLYRYYVTEK